MHQDYNTQINTGSVGGGMHQGGGFGNNVQINTGSVGGGMHQGGGFGSKLQSNLGRVGGSMHQGGGSGNSQTNHGTVDGSMHQDYNTQINTGSVGGGMHQGGGFGNNVQGNDGGVGGSMVQGGGFGNSQTNSGNVGGDMVQDYSAEMSCKLLKTRLKLCGEGLYKKESCDIFSKRYKKKNCKNKANDYQFNLNCSNVVCNSRDYQNTVFQQCCSANISG